MTINNWKCTVISSIRIKRKKLTRKKRIIILDKPKKMEKKEKRKEKTSQERREIQLDLEKVTIDLTSIIKG